VKSNSISKEEFKGEGLKGNELWVIIMSERFI